MRKIKLIISIILILGFTAKAVFASVMRCTASNAFTICHTPKKSVSGNSISDDPSASDDFNPALHQAGHHMKKFIDPFMMIGFTVLIPVMFGSASIVPTKTSGLYSNNLSDIFIPPEHRA